MQRDPTAQEAFRCRGRCSRWASRPPGTWKRWVSGHFFVLFMPGFFLLQNLPWQCKSQAQPATKNLTLWRSSALLRSPAGPARASSLSSISPFSQAPSFTPPWSTRHMNCSSQNLMFARLLRIIVDIIISWVLLGELSWALERRIFTH